MILQKSFRFGSFEFINRLFLGFFFALRSFLVLVSKDLSLVVLYIIHEMLQLVGNNS